MKVTLYPNLIDADSDTLPVFVGYIHGKLRFNGRGGADIRRNHPPQRRIWGTNGTAPTLLANQTEYHIAYEDDL